MRRFGLQTKGSWESGGEGINTRPIGRDLYLTLKDFGTGPDTIWLWALHNKSDSLIHGTFTGIHSVEAARDAADAALKRVLDNLGKKLPNVATEKG